MASDLFLGRELGLPASIPITPSCLAEAMDAYEVSRIVYSRVQAMEPEHVSKIMGYLLLQDRGEQEMLRLAFSQDAVLQELVQKVKKELGLTSASSPSRASLMAPPFLGPSHLGPPYHHLPHQQQQQHHHHHQMVGSPSSAVAAGNSEHLYSALAQAGEDRFLPPSDLSLPSPDTLRFQNSGNRYGFPEVEDRTFSEHMLRNDLQLADQLSFLNEPHDVAPLAAHSYGFSAQDYLNPDTLSLLNAKLTMDNVLPPRYSGRRFSASDLPMSPDSLASAAAWKPCLYYARGYCKHGSTCKFLHSHSRSDASFLLSPSSGQSQDSGSDDGLLPGSLERLEFELQELLRGRKAPISIASLPQLYYERYGKTLQADGYLTESQRHGKAGYSLTKLLARLKNSVTLIDRPHGQHAVVLAEDAHKFTAYRGGGGGVEKEEQQLMSGANPGSRQIYLTFPADSAFTEEDVSAHFRAYGPVQDVRIPYQQKRMFGFVTFVYPETVRMILAKGNPHFICGARVLVKPYKEKGKHADRKYPDRDYPRFLAGPQPLDMHRDFDYITGPRFFLEQDLLRRQLEEQERIVEMERKRLAELQLEKHRRFQQQQQQQQEQQITSPPPSPSPSLAASLPPSLALHAEGISTTTAVSPQEANGNSSTLLFEDTPLPAEDDLQSIKTSSAFEYLVDAMDGNEAGEELQGQKYQPKENTSSDDAHNLPDSPFTSPHKPFSSPPPTPPPPSPPLSAASASTLPSAAAGGNNKPTLKSVSSGPPPGFAVPSTVEKTLNCRICKGFFMDRVELDCGHAFCVQCILKVIRVSKDECPICQRHIGSQIVKLIETRRLQVVDMW